jgi:hypothetical protein
MPTSITIPNSQEFFTSASKPKRRPKLTVDTLVKYMLEELDNDEAKEQIKRATMTAVSVPRGYTWEQVQEMIARFNAEGSWSLYTRNSERDTKYGVIVSPTKEVLIKMGHSDR